MAGVLVQRAVSSPSGRRSERQLPLEVCCLPVPTFPCMGQRGKSPVSLSWFLLSLT